MRNLQEGEFTRAVLARVAKYCSNEVAASLLVPAGQVGFTPLSSHAALAHCHLTVKPDDCRKPAAHRGVPRSALGMDTPGHGVACTAYSCAATPPMWRGSAAAAMALDECAHR